VDDARAGSPACSCPACNASAPRQPCMYGHGAHLNPDAR
jgi:hypothetical protein